MKRKLFILGTLGLAGLFAGGVVAAYTISDLADEAGIKITPGTITDDEVGNVTLEWGDMTAFTKVEGLDATTKQTRTVTIKATKTDEDGVLDPTAVYLGKLDVELKDLSGKASTAERLIDYLHVDIKGYTYSAQSGFAPEKSVLGVIPTEGENAFKTSLGVYADKIGKTVDFEISLDAKAVPVMAEIMSDQVYLTVDWNRSEDSDTGLKHVYIPSNGWSAMYVYAYSANGGQNKDWPGVQLTMDSKTGMFEGDISEHDFYIFNDGSSNQYPASGEDGMTKAEINYATASAIYFDWTSHTFTSVEPVVAAPYYLVGESTGWSHKADLGFVLDDNEKPSGVVHQYHLVAEVEANKEYKFNSGDGSVWIGSDVIEDQSLIDDVNGNFKFKTAGTYEFYLKEMEGGAHSCYVLKKN